MVYSRKFKHPKEDLLEEGRRIVAESSDSKYLFRVSMVNLILAGAKPSELSQYCGVDERTLTGWVAKADDHGFQSLMAVKQTGRPPKLDDEQKEKIKFVLQEDPSKYGYSNWDGPSLSDHIRSEHGVEYSVRACQKLMRDLGFSLVRPQIHPSLNGTDENARTEFKNLLQEAYHDPNRVVVFQDEVHFSIQTTVTRAWVIKGSRPRVKSYPGRKNISYSGFVKPDTGELWTTKPGWFNYETTIESFREFLDCNPLDEGKRYCIVLDNAPWHKKAKRLIMDESEEEYADIRAKVEFISLPPYSPDLNPIEQVWRITRRERTHNRFFPDLKTLTDTVDSFLNGLSTPNQKLKNLCGFEWMTSKTRAS